MTVESFEPILQVMNLLNTKQAAERLRVTQRRVVAMIVAGKIRAHRIGREYAIEEGALVGVKTYGKTGRPLKDQPGQAQRPKATIPRGKK